MRGKTGHRYAVGVHFTDADGDSISFFLDPMIAKDLAESIFAHAGTEVPIGGTA